MQTEIGTDPAIIRLQSEKDELGSFDKLAKKYNVNVRYVWQLLTKGIYPPPKIRRKLGMITTKPHTPFQIARDGMADETKASLKGWKQ